MTPLRLGPGSLWPRRTPSHGACATSVLCVPAGVQPTRTGTGAATLPQRAASACPAAGLHLPRVLGTS